MPTSGDALCRTLEPAARAHAGALAAEAGDTAVVTGDRLLAGLATGCQWRGAQ